MSAIRGEYRAIHVALVDDPDFLELSPPARLSLMTLKLILGASGIDVVRALVPELMALTGHGEAEVRAAVDELKAGDWIRTEGRVVWLRNGLRYEPARPLSSENGRKGVSGHLATLPRVALVNEFAAYYDLPAPFPEIEDTRPTEGATPPPTEPLPNPLRRGSVTPSEPPTEAGKREEGRGSTTTGSIDPEAAPRGETPPEGDHPPPTEPSPAPPVDTPPGQRPASEPPPGSTLGARLAPLIREHLWLGDRPPSSTWHMGRDLSIAERLVREGVSADHLAGAIEHAREALRLEAHTPFTMRIFWTKDRRDRLEAATAAWRRAEMKRASTPQRIADDVDRALAVVGVARV